MSFEKSSVEVSPEYQEELKEKKLKVVNVEETLNNEEERLRKMKKVFGAGIKAGKDLGEATIDMNRWELRKFGDKKSLREIVESVDDELVRLEFMRDEIEKGNTDIAEGFVNEFTEK